MGIRIFWHSKGGGSLIRDLHEPEAVVTKNRGCLAPASPTQADLSTWGPKVCTIMAFMAIIMGLGLL